MRTKKRYTHRRRGSFTDKYVYYLYLEQLFARYESGRLA